MAPPCRAAPLSGGYAAEEAERADLGLRFTSVLPRLTPATDLGAEAVSAYAERAGVVALDGRGAPDIGRRSVGGDA